jgi:hypothetical protein
MVASFDHAVSGIEALMLSAASPTETDCVAGLEGFELGNVCAPRVFEIL